MKKRYFIENLKKKFHINRAVPIIVMIVVLGLSIGYSAFSSNLSITGIVSTIEAQKDIRISNVSVDTNSSGSTGNYICELASDSEITGYNIGAKYNCDPGDGVVRTFYIIEDGDDYGITAMSGEISLIMDRNIGENVLYGNNGETAMSYLLSHTEELGWTVDVSMFTYQQFMSLSATDFEYELDDSFFISNIDDSTTLGYWIYDDMDYGYLFVMTSTWLNDLEIDSTDYGVRPVITINKSQIGIATSALGTVSGLTFDNTSISANIDMPEDNSKIAFDVEIKNLGNVESGIFEITGLPDNLNYKFLHYEEKSKLCDEELKCSLGMTKNITLVIEYKEDGFVENSSGYNINLVFNFQPVYNVSYIGMDYVYSYYPPTEVLGADTFEIDFKEYWVHDIPVPGNVYVYMDDIQISNYTYENGLLTIPNVSGNIEIKDGLRNSTFSDNFIVLNDVKSTNIKGLTISGNSVQDGTPTPTNPVEIESVGDYDSTTGKYVIPITISGKNLMNTSGAILNGGTKTTIESGFKLVPTDKTGGNSNSNNYGRFIHNNNSNKNLYLEAGSYIISYDINILEYSNAGESQTKTSHFIYTSDSATEVGSVGSVKTIDFASGKITYTFTLTTPKWITYALRLNGMTVEITNMQLEKGSEASSYETYVEPITHNIYLDEPLRKINSSYDYIDFNAGVVVRNIAEVKLTGKENWAEYKSTDTYKRFITKALDGKAKQNQYAKVYSNYFKGTSTIGTVNGIRIASGTAMTEFYLDPLEFQDLASFKSWMSTNNIIVDYILNTSADPESIELPNINLIKGYNEITIGTTIAPTVTISYY